MKDELVEVGSVTLYPPWEEAIRLFLAAGFSPGDIVADDWIRAAMGLVHEESGSTPDARAELRLEYLAQKRRFRRELNLRHQIDICSRKRHGGYRYLRPDEVADVAMNESDREIRRQRIKAKRRLLHTDLSLLTDEQRRNHCDAMLRLQRDKRESRRTRQEIRNEFKARALPAPK